jgi:hypothetical protein
LVVVPSNLTEVVDHMALQRIISHIMVQGKIMSNLDMTQHNLIEPVVHTTSKAMVDIFQMPVSSTMVHAEANNTPSGHGKGQTYHRPNGYGTYNSGYNTQSNQKIYKQEGATTGQYGYGPSGQGPNSVGNDQQVFRQHQYVDHRSGGWLSR